MSESEANSRRELLELAEQMIAVTTDEHGTLIERMADRFHWMLAFEEGVRDRCAKELVEAARASLAANQSDRVVTTLVAWKDSAESIAAGRESTQVDWLETPVPVKFSR